MVEERQTQLEKILAAEDLVAAVEESIIPQEEGIIDDVEAGIILSVASECGVSVCTDDEGSIFVDDGKDTTIAQEVDAAELVKFCLTYLESLDKHMNSVDPVYSSEEYLPIAYKRCIMQRLLERIEG